MKSFYVRKIFPYDPTEGGKYSKYEGYNLSTSKGSNPHIINPIEIELPAKKRFSILSSPLVRAKETAKYISKQYYIDKLIHFHELEEITFSMKKLIKEEEYMQFGSNFVRERFIEAFIDDNLNESREEIYNRLNSFISKLYTLDSGNYVIISHSFFLKIMLIYLEIGKQLFEEPTILKMYFDTNVKTFNYGTGFDFVLDERKRNIELI